MLHVYFSKEGIIFTANTWKFITIGELAVAIYWELTHKNIHQRCIHMQHMQHLR